MTTRAVVRIVVHRVRVPMRTPLRSAALAQASRGSVLVEVHTSDGSIGWGECPALDAEGYATETLETAWAALCDQIAPAVLAGRTPAVLGVPAALGAVADALLDARLRAEGRPLERHLAERLGDPGPTGAGGVASSVTWGAVLADVGLDAATAVDAARAAVAQGASMVKVKFDGRSTGVEVLGAVRDAVGVPVAADANGRLDASGAHRVDDLGLAYLEQPLPATTPWNELAELAGSLHTPVALDESITSADAVRDAARSGAMGVVSVKPARLGGVEAAATAARVALACGVRPFVGGMFELGVGRSTAIALAAALQAVVGPGSVPSDLGPTGRYLAADVCEPLRLGSDGAVAVPTGPGWGAPPDRAAVEAHLERRESFGA